MPILTHPHKSKEMITIKIEGNNVSDIFSFPCVRGIRKSVTEEIIVDVCVETSNSDDVTTYVIDTAFVGDELQLKAQDSEVAKIISKETIWKGTKL